MDISEDRFLGGRIVARQPVEGFRSGTDAVMLAAAVPAKVGDDALELGCGVGTASLCIGTRVPKCRITGVEIAPELVALANENARVNKLDDRVRFEEADVFQLPRHLREEFEHVLCNPPFHEIAGEISPNADRARALSDREGLGNWIGVAFARVGSGGTLTVILRADRLAEVLGAVPPNGVSIFPLWPRRSEPAKRVIVQIRKGSHAPLHLLSGLILHDNESHYTPEADAVLRGQTSLALANPHL